MSEQRFFLNYKSFKCVSWNSNSNKVYLKNNNNNNNHNKDYLEIHDNDLTSFPSFLSTKQGHRPKRTKTGTKTVFVEVLKGPFGNVLTVGCFNFFFEISLEVFL